MSLTRIANLLLVLAWTLCIIGLCIVSLWFITPDLIHKIDEKFRYDVIYEPRERYTTIAERYEQQGDQDLIIAALIGLLGELDDIQKVDELAATKRAAYGQLVRVLIHRSEFPRAMQWADQWLAFDQKDIQGLLVRARLLVINPDTYAQGEFELAKLQQQFPNSLIVADGRANAWASIGELGRAFVEYQPFLPSSDNSLTHKFGDVLVVYEHQQTKGAPVEPFRRSLPEDQSLAVRIEVNPETTALEFDINQEEVVLTAYPIDESFSFKVIGEISPPETFNLLTAPRFRDLVLSQLTELEALSAIVTYEAYLEGA